MKTLVLFLAILPAMTYAQTVLEANNTKVGNIELTDDANDSYCSIDHPMRAVVTDYENTVTPTCYTLTATMVEIKWYDGVIVRYSIKLFIKN